MKLRSVERSAKILLDFLGEPPYGNVLDLGAKDGALGWQIQANYYPLDVSHINHPNFIKHDLNKLPLPLEDKFFNYVFASMIVEHVWQPRELLLEIKRVMKDGGKLVLALPDENSVMARYDMFFTPFGSIDDQRFGHHWRFTYDNTKTLLRSVFKIVKEAGRFGTTSEYLIGIAPAVLFLCTK